MMLQLVHAILHHTKLSSAANLSGRAKTYQWIKTSFRVHGASTPSSSSYATELCCLKAFIGPYEFTDREKAPSAFPQYAPSFLIDETADTF